MQVTEILKEALNKVSKLSHTEITEEVFHKTVAEIKASVSQIINQLESPEQRNQAEDIIKYQIMSQRSAFDRFLLRHLSRAKYVWPAVKWTKKGNFVYDLDQLELKLGGLIYKIETQYQDN